MQDASSHYSGIYQELLSHLDRPDITAVYEYGKVNSPGLSDIDIIVITDDPAPDLPSHLEKLPEVVNAAMNGGTLMIMNSNSLAEIRLWDDVQLRSLAGETSIIMPSPDTEFVKVARIVDWLPERLLRLEPFMTIKNLAVRKVLGLLHSLNFTIRSLTDDFDISTENTNMYLEEVELYREQFANYWLEHGTLMPLADKSHLQLLVTAGVIHGSSLLNMFSEMCVKNVWYGDSIPSQITFGGNRILKLSHTPFYHHFATYASIPGIISDRVREKLVALEPTVKEYIEIDDALRALLIARMEWVNDAASFLKSHGFKSGLFKMGWWYDEAL